MSTQHATPSADQENRPSSIHEALPSDQAVISRPPTQEGDPFRTSSGSQDRASQPQISSTPNIAQPPLTYYPLSPTTVNRGGDAVSLWRQDAMAQNRLSGYQRADVDQPLPPLPSVARLPDSEFAPRRQTTISINPRLSAAPQSARLSHTTNSRQALNERPELYYDDKAVPVIRGSVKSRLSKTIESATSERDKYASRARITGLALNIAIGLQVLLGSLTTGLSAVATRGKSAAVATTILGALATLVASYLARARGSNEPELSITRVKDLEHFLRDCKNFSDDHGDYVGHEFDKQLEEYRVRFEELLGNANGERKLSPPGS